MVKHVKNLDRWYLVPEKKGVPFEGTLSREVEMKVMCVGPCVLYVTGLANGKAVGDRMLLGYVDGGEETFRWRMAGNFAVTFDASGEVWVYRDQTPVGAEAPNGKSMTRVEKAGLYVDELGHALHRQAVLQRLATRQKTDQETAYTRGLEKRLEELVATVAALKPAPKPVPEPGRDEEAVT